MEKRAMFLALFLTLSLPGAAELRTAGFHSLEDGQEIDQSPDTLKKRQKSFDIVWRTVKDKLFDPTLRGVDWNAVRARYEPRLKEVRTDEEFNRLLNQMLYELHLTHLEILSAHRLQRDAEAKGDIGIDLRVIDGRAVITSVGKGSSAESGGLAPGFVVTQIDGMSLDQFLDRETDLSWFPSYRIGEAIGEMIYRTRGPIGSTLQIRYLDRDNKEGTITVVREKRRAELTDRGMGHD
ncbi:MAG: hypothetical protein ACREDR_18805, partial [Blastocatellia bacterium]